MNGRPQFSSVCSCMPMEESLVLSSDAVWPAAKEHLRRPVGVAFKLLVKVVFM